jgi:hypothetical protein
MFQTSTPNQSQQPVTEPDVELENDPRWQRIWRRLLAPRDDAREEVDHAETTDR